MRLAGIWWRTAAAGTNHTSRPACRTRRIISLSPTATESLFAIGAGAQVIANLILDPAIQAAAQDPATLGFQTVLDLNALTAEDRARFDALTLGPATLSPADLGPVLLEPHASWMVKIAEDWAQRYGVAQ